jgi:hypothetical protein
VAVCCATAGGTIAMHVLRETEAALEATTCVLEPPAELDGAARVVRLAFSDDGRFGAALYAHADGGSEVIRVFLGADPHVARLWRMAEAGDAAVVSCGWGAAEPGEPWRCALHAILSDGRALHWAVALRGEILVVDSLARNARARLPEAVRLAALERGRVAEIPTTDEPEARAEPPAGHARRSLSDARRPPAAPASGRESSILPGSRASGTPRSLPLTARGSTASYAHAGEAACGDADAYLPLPRARALDAEPSAWSESKCVSTAADDDDWRAALAADGAALAPRALGRGAEAAGHRGLGSAFAALLAPSPLAPAAAANVLARPIEHSMALLSAELAHLHEALALEAEAPAQTQPHAQHAHAAGHAPKSAMARARRGADARRPPSLRAPRVGIRAR